MKFPSEPQQALLTSLAAYGDVTVRVINSGFRVTFCGPISWDASGLRVADQDIELDWRQVRRAVWLGTSSEGYLSLQDGDQELLQLQVEAGAEELMTHQGVLWALPMAQRDVIHLALPNGFQITEISSVDRPLYLKYLNDPDIYHQTLRIPHPYTEADADDWLIMVDQEHEIGGCGSLAIRNPGGQLVGGVGFHHVVQLGDHQAEIAYWLAKPYWNRGIVSQAVQALCRYGFEELALKRIYAHVFETNQASARVLQKAGFHLEGVLRQHYSKDQKIFDGLSYARLAPL